MCPINTSNRLAKAGVKTVRTDCFLCRRVNKKDK